MWSDKIIVELTMEVVPFIVVIAVIAFSFGFTLGVSIL